MTSKRNIFFSYQENVSSPVYVKDWAEIVTIMKSDRVKNVCKQLQELDPSAQGYNELKAKLKKKLPAMTPHAYEFADNARKNENALWSGYVCLDYDHLTEEEVLKFYEFGRNKTTFVGLGYGPDFMAKSASGRGVFVLVRVKDQDYNLIQHTVQKAHETLCFQIGRSIDSKLDEAYDLARLRYLPCYDYVIMDKIGEHEVFQDACVISQYQNLYDWSSSLVLSADEQLEGHRHSTYKKLVLEAVKYSKNKLAILFMLPDLGLPKEERESLVDWGLRNIAPTAFKKNSYSPNKEEQPLDYESLPFPKSESPELITMLVDQLPACWKQTAALALLPALSVAAGGLSYGNNKPLAFQVAVYGRAGSGKSQFTCAPAQQVMEILSQNDNNRRKNIEKLKEGWSVDELLPTCPNVLGFDTSVVQLAKYLQYARNTVMLYTDEISSAVGSDKNSFMALQPLLRKGYDGIEHIMDFKDVDSFRGKIKPRLSYLACGTPTTMFKYFNEAATEQGSTRRTILVEHPSYKQEVKEVRYNEKQLSFIKNELCYLQGQSGVIYDKDIEDYVLYWKRKRQKACGDDEVKLLMVNTPADTLRRAAYLAFALFRYDEGKKYEAIQFGCWVAEYQLRSYSNRTYQQLKAEEKNQQRYVSISTQAHQAAFNKQMLVDLPDRFSMGDVESYRIMHAYPHNVKSMVILTRWQKNGDVHKIGNGVFEKLRYRQGDA